MIPAPQLRVRQRAMRACTPRTYVPRVAAAGTRDAASISAVLIP